MLVLESDPHTDVLARIQRAGKETFAGIAMTGAQLEGLLRGRELEAEIGDARAAEVFLTCACAIGDPAAIRHLQQRYLSGVARSLLRGRNANLVEEALQQLTATMFLPRVGRPPEIADFAGSGPLSGWLRIATLRILLRLERRERRAVHDVPIEGTVAASMDPEVIYLRSRYGSALQNALVDAWNEMSPPARVLLRMRYTDNLGIDDIASSANIHRATAARRVKRAEETLVASARRLLRERLDADDGDINSVLRHIRSQINLSVSQIVRG